MQYDLAFAPQIPVWLIVALLAVLSVPVILGLKNKLRGSLFRAFAWSAFALALFNPSLLLEDREKLTSIVAIVSDESGSQKLKGREAQTHAVRANLLKQLQNQSQFEVRQINVKDQISSTTDVSTALFSALKLGLKDIPDERLAGAIFITDGQVHDIPQSINSLTVNAPIHALITGKKDEKDRRITILQAPRYGVVGESYEISYKVDETGFDNKSEVEVSIYVDGKLVTVEDVIPGEEYTFFDEISHGGRNIIELRVEADPEEITDANNRVFSTLNGIRENLRVLLVSGEPHAGERTWRNLLKSDASVDLVHFTILRPPEKQDGTPINQLSLIAFPTRELFVEKIDEFDLIIFDRYSRRGVLPILYFDNIARYVNDGGAVLVAAGPEFGKEGSIAQTPLASVLPAKPNGIIREEPFKPLISNLGNKHPVTRGLDNGKADDPDWSRWFRSIGVEATAGNVLMEGVNKEPLLVLQRFGEGRVALLLSDHAWLWARGFEGGGPHVQLLRRISHWLMKEPELEEENISASSNGSDVTITRQTLGDMPDHAVVTAPNGKEGSVEYHKQSDGIFTADFTADDIGLHQISDGKLNTLVHVGPANPREYREVVSTTEKLEPLLSQSGGSVTRIGTENSIPKLISIHPGANAKGNGWMGLQNTGATILKGIDRVSLFAGFLGLALLLLSIATMWTREGR